jgi:hypothetical protein
LNWEENLSICEKLEYRPALALRFGCETMHFTTANTKELDPERLKVGFIGEVNTRFA